MLLQAGALLQGTLNKHTTTSCGELANALGLSHTGCLFAAVIQYDSYCMLRPARSCRRMEPAHDPQQGGMVS